MGILVNGLGGEAGFGEESVYRSDDGYASAIDITSVFGPQGINFYGTYYTELYVNTNGNITFGSGLSSYTPTEIGADVYDPIIAPYWADVDTRNSTDIGVPTPGGTSQGTNLAWYDLDTANGTFTVTWDDVGYYSHNNDKLNAFQLVMEDTGDGNFNLTFNYEDVNWTTGNASGGTDGLGGTVARAGFSVGDGVHYYELYQSGNEAEMLALDLSMLDFHWEFVNGESSSIAGTTGDDEIHDTDDNPYIYAGDGSDIVYLADDDNIVVLGEGNDYLHGGAGNDIIYSGLGDNFIDGGAGYDTVVYPYPEADYDNQVVDGTGQVLNVVTGAADWLENIENMIFGDPILVHITPDNSALHEGGTVVLDVTLSRASEASIFLGTDGGLDSRVSFDDSSIWYLAPGETSTQIVVNALEDGEATPSEPFNINFTVDGGYDEEVIFFNYSNSLSVELDYMDNDEYHPTYEPTDEPTDEPNEPSDHISGSDLMDSMMELPGVEVNDLLSMMIAARFELQIQNGVDSPLGLAIVLSAMSSSFRDTYSIPELITVIEENVEALEAAAGNFDETIVVADLSTNDATAGDIKFEFNLSAMAAASLNGFATGDAIDIDNSIDSTGMIFDTDDANQITLVFGDITDFNPTWTVNFNELDTALVASVEAAEGDVDAQLALLNTAWGDWII